MPSRISYVKPARTQTAQGVAVSAGAGAAVSAGPQHVASPFDAAPAPGTGGRALEVVLALGTAVAVVGLLLDPVRSLL